MKKDYRALRHIEKRFNISIGETVFHKVERELFEEYDIRFNIIKDSVEFKPKKSDNYVTINDRQFNGLFCEMGKLNLKLNPTIFNCILNSPIFKEYHAFKDYFNRLKWDGKDHIYELAKTVKTSNESLWNKYLLKWLVGTVACACEMSENHLVLSFIGSLGIGKTKWFKRLIPPSLTEYLSTGTMDPHDKDSAIRLIENLIVLIDDYDSKSRIEISKLKSLISDDFIDVRRPYGRRSEKTRKRASLLATSNDFEFISDLMGNRRFICITAEEIDYKHSINIDQVYAQAYHILTNKEENFEYWLDEIDILEIERNNENYRKISLEEEYITKFFEPYLGQPGHQCFKMMPTDMMAYISENARINFLNYTSHQKFGRILRKLGYRKISTATQKFYKVILRPTESPET